MKLQDVSKIVAMVSILKSCWLKFELSISKLEMYALQNLVKHEDTTSVKLVLVFRKPAAYLLV